MNFLIFIACIGGCWKKAIQSVMMQEYDKKKIFIIVVQDGCGEEKIYPIQSNWQWLVWERAERNFAPKNFYEGIRKAECFGLSNETVICVIDGDDEGFADNSVLARLNSLYQDKELWLTYGSYKRKSDGLEVGRRYQRGADVRKVDWRASHLRTFRYGLAIKIPESALKKQSGEWHRVCVDLLTMFPMMEMSGLDRTEMVDKVLYLYDDTLSNNDYRERCIEQHEVAEEIRQYPKFKRIENL